ncbi:MAG: acyl carrier protein [Polyangiales bacterium]
MSASVIDKVREFIFATYPVADRSIVTDDASLPDLGVMDSTGYLELFDWLKADMGIDVRDDEMNTENFESIRRIADFIARRAAA